MPEVQGACEKLRMQVWGSGPWMKDFLWGKGGGVTIIRPNIDPRIVGSPYNEDPSEVPLISSTPRCSRIPSTMGRADAQ